jgi:hypothetical protein
MITIKGRNGMQESVLLGELKKRGYDVEYVTEAKKDSDKDLGELIDAFIDNRNMHHFEGSRGVRYLLEIIQTCDRSYHDFETFFSDNSGAIEAVLEWIKNARVNEWKENFHLTASDDE